MLSIRDTLTLRVEEAEAETKVLRDVVMASRHS